MQTSVQHRVADLPLSSAAVSWVLGVETAASCKSSMAVLLVKALNGCPLSADDRPMRTGV